MCGIVGIIERDLARPVVVDDVERMVRTLTHRGPDEEGRVVLPGVGLAMRRLSIVDLASGQQPIANEDGAIQVVANGEIYNSAEIRDHLEARGHRFRSRRSDIEVLVHAYEEYGEAFLRRVRGMFALALWDDRSRTLLAARDRAGEKPLYYTQTPDGLRLASEIKALLSRPEVSRDIDLEALDQFLTYEYVIAPRTIFKNIKKLPAAHYLVLRDGQLAVKRYWDAADVPARHWQDEDAAAALRETLGRAVRSQMMSDVPLGVFLSGGIDSSAVALFMRDAAAEPVSSFSMGFADGSYNELPFAREVAALCGTKHYEGSVTPDIAGLFDRLVVHLDEPFADVSLFPTFLVSQIAREHVKVVLTGDGGDELFGGYDAYEAQALAAGWSKMAPEAVTRAAHVALAMVPPTEQKKGLINKARRFVEGVATAPADIAQYRWMTFLPAAAKRRLYAGAFRDALITADAYAPVRAALAASGTDDWLNRQLYADLSIYLADDILVKVDRMSMATSLETRAPFLDVDVMELAFSMPGALKIRKNTRKWILKEALRGALPSTILDRRKEGFSIPMKNWLKRELAPLMDQLLSADRLRARGLIDPMETARLVREHREGRANHAHVLFSLMVFERWAEEFAV